MKRYGLVLADNGSPWYFQGTADERWPSGLLDQLKSIPASAFEAVDTAPLRVRAGQRQGPLKVVRAGAAARGPCRSGRAPVRCRRRRGVRRRRWP